MLQRVVAGADAQPRLQAEGIALLAGLAFAVRGAGAVAAGALALQDG